MKRIAMLLLTLAMLFSLIACGLKDTQPADTADTPPAEQPASDAAANEPQPAPAADPQPEETAATPAEPAKPAKADIDCDEAMRVGNEYAISIGFTDNWDGASGYFPPRLF